MDLIWHFSKTSSQKSICTQSEFLDDCVEKRSWQRQHRHGQPLLFMSLSKLKNENTRLTPCLVRSFTKSDCMHFASINFFHMSFSSSSYIVNVLVLFIGTSVFVEVGWKQLWTFGNSTRHPECRTSQHPSAYLGSAANETMNSVMEWLRPVMMSLLSAIEIYRNVMKWWWFILKPWVFPCRFTTPKKFPLTGAWVELGGAKHPPIFDRARTTHQKYQRFGRPSNWRWQCRWYIICQQPSNPDRFSTNCSHWGFPPTPAPFPPTPQIVGMVRVPVSFGTDPKYWRYFW